MVDPLGHGTSSVGIAPRRRPWLLFLCVPVVLVCALVPFASLKELHAPLWLGIVAALVVFPALPLGWHFLADRKRSRAGLGDFLDRFAVRSLSLALVVLAVSLCNLGPRQVAAGLLEIVRPDANAPQTAAAIPAEPAPAPGTPRHELEPFIPEDASLVVALSDSAIMQQFLGVNGTDTKKTLAALEKCQIVVSRARALIASRDADTRMIVVRADGITDPRNLYCLVGFLGKDRLSLRFTSDKAPVSFEVEGLTARPLKFKAIDERTVVASEGGWAQGAGKLLYPPGATTVSGPLGPVLSRIDRGASLWSGSVRPVAQGVWDLAIDARFEGTYINLSASSVPPSGKADRAEGQLHVPLNFAQALPAAALNDGLRGLVALVAAIGPVAPWPKTSDQRP
jgi:hypothetical protein